MIKAALLDIDGTLVDSNPQHALAWTRALSEYGYDVPQERMIKLIGMGADKILPTIDAALSDGTEPGRSIAERAGEIFAKDYVEWLSPTPGARELLLGLHQRHVTRVIATSASELQLAATLKAAKLSGQFDAAVTADKVAQSKPDADVVSKGLEKARVQPGEAIFVGDTPYDMEAARAAGVLAIGLRCGGWHDSDLKAADAIYNDPADLLIGLDASGLLCRDL